MEFEDVHRLVDGQAKHSPEVFYAGSLWKVQMISRCCPVREFLSSLHFQLNEMKSMY